MGYALAQRAGLKSRLRFHHSWGLSCGDVFVPLLRVGPGPGVGAECKNFEGRRGEGRSLVSTGRGVGWRGLGGRDGGAPGVSGGGFGRAEGEG